MTSIKPINSSASNIITSSKLEGQKLLRLSDSSLNKTESLFDVVYSLPHKTNPALQKANNYLNKQASIVSCRKLAEEKLNK